MGWKELLDRGSLTRHRTSQQEMSSWRSMVRRDLGDASLAGLSSDRSFGISYGAVLVLAKMVISVSDTEAEELLKKAEEFRCQVEAWIRRSHPHLRRLED